MKSKNIISGLLFFRITNLRSFGLNKVKSFTISGIAFMFVFFLMNIEGWGQTTTVNMGKDGASNTLPFNNYYKNSYNQMIYTKEELGAAKAITSISFYYAAVPTTAWQASSLKVYLGHTSLGGSEGETDLTTTSWVPEANLTLVSTKASYTPVSVTSTVLGAWVTITLDNSFAYNGTDNLAVVIKSQCTTYQTGLTFSYINDLTT